MTAIGLFLLGSAVALAAWASTRKRPMCDFCLRPASVVEYPGQQHGEGMSADLCAECELDVAMRAATPEEIADECSRAVNMLRSA